MNTSQSSPFDPFYVIPGIALRQQRDGNGTQAATTKSVWPRLLQPSVGFQSEDQPVEASWVPFSRRASRASPGMTKKRRSDAGYTLVELLVVVAILGLLTLIATPFVLRYLDSAKVSTARTEIANISAGLDLFKIDVGRYPTTEEGLDALMKPPQGVDNWNGPYIKKVNGLKDPWGRPYLYRSPGQHGEFDVYSYGAKGEASASAEKPQVANW